MRTTRQALDMIKKFESLHDGDLRQIGLQPKMCPSGFWTEGYGILVRDEAGNRLAGASNKMKALQCSKIHTVAEAEKALISEIEKRETQLYSIHLPLSDNQFSALVSFIYNVGFENFKSSTLLKKIKDHASEKEIRIQFMKWIYCNKEILPGLVHRREAEATLYFKN